MVTRSRIVSWTITAALAMMPAVAFAAESPATADAPANPAAPAATAGRIDASPPIRSVQPAASVPATNAPRVAVLATPADGAVIEALQQALQQLGANVILVPLAPGDAFPGVTATASTAAFHAPAASAAAVPPPAYPALAWDGQLRYRYETRTLLDYRLPGTFGRAGTQLLSDRGDVSIMRMRLGANLRLAPGVRGYVSLQDARTMGAEGSPSGTLNSVDLYHAWLDLDSLGSRNATLRVGRQVVSYGDGRVVSGADWGNAGRAFDGARLRWAPARAQVDGFVVWINEGRTTGQDRVLSGLDALWKPVRGVEAEGYHFRRGFGDAAWTGETGTKGGLHDRTTGARAKLTGGPLELKLEGAGQSGHRGGDAVRAWFGVARLTADLRSAWKTRIFAERLVASGDPNPADGTFGRFDPVYWGGHGFQGTLDIAGESNLADWCGGATAQPAKGWSVQSEMHVFRLASATDAWVDDAGNTLRRDGTGAAGRALGREFDATVRWDTRGKVSVLAGASRFWRGEFVNATGGGPDMNWGFLQLSVAF